MKQNRERWYCEQRGHCVRCRWQAGGTGAYICLWHQQLKTITCALFLWPRSLSLHTSFFSLPSIDVWRCSIFSTQVPADWFGSLSRSFSFSLILSLSGRFSPPIFYIFMWKPNTDLPSDLVSKYTLVYTLFTPTQIHTHAGKWRCICWVRAFCNNSSHIWLEV